MRRPQRLYPLDTNTVSSVPSRNVNVASAQVSPEPDTTAKVIPRKPQAFITYCEARKNHQSIGASGRAAGVSRVTATRYEAIRIQEIERENRLLDAKGAIATKNEVAQELSKSLRDCEPQYKAGIASSLAKVMGYEAPTRSQIEVRSVPASVESWMQSCLTIDVESQEAKTLPVDERKSLPPKGESY